MIEMVGGTFDHIRVYHLLKLVAPPRSDWSRSLQPRSAAVQAVRPDPIWICGPDFAPLRERVVRSNAIPPKVLLDHPNPPLSTDIPMIASSVFPQRRKAARPESVFTGAGYGFRVARFVRPRNGDTVDQMACYDFQQIRGERLMEGLWIGVLGTAGTILSTVSLLPQVIRTWRTRSANDISAMWLVAALMSMLIWVAYGILISAPAVVLVNVLCFFQCTYILFIKMLNQRAPIVERS